MIENMDISTTTISSKDSELEWDPLQAQFSYYCAPISNTRPRWTVTLAHVFNYITSVKALEITRAFRDIKAPDERKRRKPEMFDNVTFSGLFSNRNDQALLQHSEMLCIDIDHLHDEADVFRVKDLLKSDSAFVTLMMFTSPSGLGVKWVIHIEPTATFGHREWFGAVKNYLWQTYGLVADPQCINVARACFLPFDSNAYVLQEVCPF